MGIYLKTVLVSLILAWLNSSALAGEPRLLPYKGRLLTPQGQPLKGTVDLEVAFFASEVGNDLKTKSPFVMKQVMLTDGVFEIRIAVDDAEYDAIFKGGSPFLQVTDKTHGVAYRRHRFDPPAAAPVVAPSVAREAQSSIRIAAASACLASPVAGSKFVAETNDTKSSCATACANVAPASTCVRGWTLYADDRYFDYGNECQVTEAPPGEQVAARVCCCQSLAGPGTLFLGAPNVAH